MGPEPQISERNSGVAGETILCRLVVPTYNEENRIRWCLEAALHSPLPDGCSWQEWVILDDGSCDSTVDVVRDWAVQHPDLTVRVDQSTRGGKASALNRYHSRLVASGCLDGIVVVIDADSAPVTGSVCALLEPLIHGDAAVTYGMDRSSSASPRQWASAFQVETVNETQRRRGMDRPRAYGRFFAYRIGLLADFRWDPTKIVDDVCLASHMERSGRPTRTVECATVVMTPAGTMHDFYLQTYRSLAAHTEIPGTNALLYHRASAALTVARAHPIWACAYLIIRALCAIRHSLRPTLFSSQWTPSTSTKLEVASIDQQIGCSCLNGDKPDAEVNRRFWGRRFAELMATLNDG